MSAPASAAPAPGRVGLLLVTHGRLGQVLLDAAVELLGPSPLLADVLEVRPVQVTSALLHQGERMLERLDRGAGVLMLTDAMGSTPANIAVELAGTDRREVIAGLNLPMLLRVFNYASSDLPRLAEVAVEGGLRGIKRYEAELRDAAALRRKQA